MAALRLTRHTAHCLRGGGATASNAMTGCGPTCLPPPPRTRPQPQTCTSNDQPNAPRKPAGRALLLAYARLAYARLALPTHAARAAAIHDIAALSEPARRCIYSRESPLNLHPVTPAVAETSEMLPKARERGTARPATAWAQHATRGSLKTSARVYSGSAIYHGLLPLERWAVLTHPKGPCRPPPPQAALLRLSPPHKRPTSVPQPSAGRPTAPSQPSLAPSCTPTALSRLHTPSECDPEAERSC